MGILNVVLFDKPDICRAELATVSYVVLADGDDCGFNIKLVQARMWVDKIIPFPSLLDRLKA